MREIIALLLMSMVFLTANFVTASRSPTVWYDEACMVDPAVSVVLGQGFKSAGWYVQSKEDVWAGYPPLQPMVLVGWLKLVGFSMAKTRAMNYVLLLLGTLLLWGAAGRLKLIPLPAARLALVALLFCGYGITFVYRSGRVDPLHILLTGAFVFVCSIRNVWLRPVLLAFIGIATSLSGFQAMTYAAIMVPLALLFLGRTFLPNALSFVLGGATGVFLLFGYYMAVGVLDKFGATTGQWLLRLGTPAGLLDYSFLLLLTAALVLGIREAVAGRFRWRSPLAFGLVSSVAAPLGVSLVGHYPIYYSWMAWLPLAFGFCAAIAEPGVLTRRRDWAIAGLALFVVSAIGLPARLALTVMQWTERDYAPVQALAARTLSRSDWVYADYPAYYAVKPIVAVTILPPYREIISPFEMRRVTHLVVKPENAAEVAEFLGGRWKDTGESVSPAAGKRGLGADKYNLTVWRRVPD